MRVLILDFIINLEDITNVTTAKRAKNTHTVSSAESKIPLKKGHPVYGTKLYLQFYENVLLKPNIVSMLYIQKNIFIFIFNKCHPTNPRKGKIFGVGRFFHVLHTHPPCQLKL